MTEEDWLASTNPNDIAHHRDSRDDRKRRLMVCACVRRVFGAALDRQLLGLVGAAEAFADDEISRSELVAVRRLVKAAITSQNAVTRDVSRVLAARAALAVSEKEFMNIKSALEACQLAQAASSGSRRDDAIQAEQSAQCQIGRDVFQNPFRRVTFNSGWGTSTALALAETIYSGRIFDRLPILADALEDAGCDATELLDHLRGQGPHVRGCWALDLVLGKG